MATTAGAKNERITFVDGEGWKKLLDEQTRRYFDMSADDFIAKCKTGAFGDPDDDERVMWLAMLLPDDE